MRTKQKRKILIIMVVILVVAMALTYVLPFTVFAEEYGTDDPSVISSEGEIYEPVEEEEEVPEPELRILDAAVRLDVGKSYKLQVDMQNFPEGTMLEWKSTDPNIAAIGGDGTIKAIATGNVEIVATAGDKRASVLVTVNELKAGSVTISTASEVTKQGDKLYEVKVGDVVKFTAAIAPEGAKVDKITWVIGNDAVATLSQSGEFVATAPGQTQVTVMADTATDSIMITIVESGIPIDRLINYILIGVIIVIVIVVIAVVLTRQSKKKKEAEARKKAAAKRRREEEERKAREEEAADTGTQYQVPEQRPVQSEDRMTKKISGAGVGAGADAARNGDSDEPERPLTLDDID